MNDQAIEERVAYLLKKGRRYENCLLSHLTPGVKGYVYTQVPRGTAHLVHRLVYKVVNGPIPEGEIVRHSCDRRNCIEPYHLITGTHAQNSEDMRNRGRSPVPRHKLSEEQLQEVVELREDGNSAQEIADYLGVVSKSTVYTRLRIARQEKLL